MDTKNTNKVKEVGSLDVDKVYKHEGLGAVSREDMKVQAIIGAENEKSRRIAEKEGLDTSPEAAHNIVAQGAKNKATTFAPTHVENAVSEDTLKETVIGGIAAEFDAFIKSLSSSEKEAYTHSPGAAVVAFQKFLGNQDPNQLQSKLIAASNE